MGWNHQPVQNGTVSKTNPFQLVENLKSLGAQGAAKLLQANISVLLGGGQT